ncbi:MAG: glycosidase [Clostridiales bacterium]|jgi:glycosidase|nr:glycosidase [Clostridiales bacterium]
MRFTRVALAVFMCAALLTASCQSSSSGSSGGSGASSSWEAAISKETTGAKKAETETRTWYEAFVYSFCDSNGDRIGDLEGLRSQLEYIRWMGFNGIWLMPIHPSPSYHKYDVKDYYEIDPDYGTLEDFDRLMEKCEQLGISVILDLVLNHSSSEHPWFKGAIEDLKNGKTDSELVSYYFFEKRAPGGTWHEATGEWCYEGQFSPYMPDLNLENELLRNELEKVMRFWLEKGVKGFRLDAIKEFVSGNATKNIEILSWISSAAKSIRPDVYLVGENWDTTDTLYTYYKGIDSQFEYPFGTSSGHIAKALLQNNGENAESFLAAMMHTQEKVGEYGGSGASDAPFFINHDNARAAGFLRRDPNLIKTAWGMNLMMSGDAFVYYGEELGMSGSGKDENKRLAMQWSSDPDAVGMTSGPKDRETVEHGFPSASEQIGDETSIMRYVRNAALMREKYPAIALGTGEILATSADPVIGALRKTYGDSSVVLVYNLSAESHEVSPSGGESWGKLSDWLSATGVKATQSGDTLTLPPRTIAILK